VKTRSVVVLVAISLLVASCGGSGTTPRTSAGVREDYRAFVHLLASGEAQRACTKYVSTAFKTALAADKRASCSSFFESAWTNEHATVSRAMAAIKAVRVDGDHATIRTRKGSRTMVYTAGHWQDSPLYKITVTDPGGTTFLLAPNPDGSITRTCHPAGAPGCSPAGTW
jgi:hypothetical protein